MRKNTKKYILILGDGMSDYYSNCPSPLMSANKPNIDRLAASGEIGLVKTVPEDFSPGSDVANLSILGYNPKQYYSGRSSLEALSMGIKLDNGDVTYRCNLVTLSYPVIARSEATKHSHGNTSLHEIDSLVTLSRNDGESFLTTPLMKDYSAGGITTDEASELISYLNKNLDLEGLELYTGISYRHCLVARQKLEAKKKPQENLMPPHDIADKPIAPYLPTGFFLKLVEQSQRLLSSHPINLARIKKELNPANSIWLWGRGTKPVLPSFESKYNIKGAMISPVDLLKGIAIASDMTNIDVKGATACINTDYSAVADAALKALKTHSFVFLHIPAPDECAHTGDYEGKKKPIKLIDQKVVGYLAERICDDCGLIIMPDHATPVSLKTHTRDAVPYLVVKNEKLKNGSRGFDEKIAKESGNTVEHGHEFLRNILST